MLLSKGNFPALQPIIPNPSKTTNEYSLQMHFSIPYQHARLK
jgi:hypothetical protein